MAQANKKPKNVIYEVMAPDGKTLLEIEGPEGANELQILQAASGLYRQQLQSLAATSDVPVLDQFNQVVQPPQAQPRPFSIGEPLIVAAETAGTLISGVPAAIGQVGGTLGALAAAGVRGEIGSPEAARLAQEVAMQQAQRQLYMPQTQAGQQMVQAVGQAAELVPPFLPMAAELQAASRFAPMAATQALMATRRAAEQAAAGVQGAVQEVAQEARAVGQGLARIATEPSPQQQAIIETIKKDPYNTDVVSYQLVGDKLKADKPANEAIKQGWKEGAIAAIKASSDEDRIRMQKMLDVYKQGKKDERFRAMNRPADILGESLNNRVQFLNDTRKRAGKDIERIAKEQLRGKSVDYTPAIDQFISDLNEIGVGVVMGQDGIARAVLRGSDIEGDTQAQKILNSTLKRLSTETPPDAYGVHTAKRFIDTQVDYGKRNNKNPLSRQAENILKGLRRNLNQSLNAQFSDYGAANTKYSETKQALDNMQNAVGSKLDFDSPNASAAFGTASRRLLSNYASRVNLIDSLDETNRIVNKYGMKTNDDIVNQLIFVNELDRMFGAPADMTFKGQISQAIQTGLDVARGNVAQRAMDLMAQSAERMRGINEENAIKEIEKILARRKAVTPGTSMVIAPNR